MHAPRPGRRARFLLTIAATLAIAVPVTVFASHQFSDVPDSNPFHSQIDKIVDAGITTGCGGGNYCPTDSVTREQMAAFMSRGFGVASGSGEPVLLDVPSGAVSTTLATLSVRTPGATGGTGYLHVVGSAYILSNYDDQAPLCPCSSIVGLYVDGLSVSGGGLAGLVDPVPFLGSMFYMADASHAWTLEVPTNTTLTLELVAFAFTTSGDPLVTAGSINAVYAPFSSGGAVSVTPVGGASVDLLDRIRTGD